MISRHVRVEWYLVEDDRWWEAFARTADTPVGGWRQSAGGETWLLRRLLQGLVLLGVALVSLAGAGLAPEQRERVLMEIGIREALSLEVEALSSHDREGLRRTIDSRVGTRWQREWSTLPTAAVTGSGAERFQIGAVQRLANIVRVEILTDRPVAGWGEVSPYRETRFYRPADGGWLRTLPEQSFWGPQHILETAHLRFEFYGQDARVVEPAVDPIESAYRSLHRTLGLVAPDNAEKLTIVIRPELVSGRGVYGDRLEITSPLLSRIPAELSADHYVARQMVSRLVYRVVYGSSFQDPDGPPSYRWSDLRRGLRYWLEDDLLSQPWPWNEETDALFRRNARGQLPLRLADISEWPRDRPRDESYYMWRNAAGKSVIAYAVATYGRERLPDLVRGFEIYHTWPDLLAGVYGATVSDFEVGWNRYLVAEYGLEMGRDADAE